jgi:hypothetical protein
MRYRSWSLSLLGLVAVSLGVAAGCGDSLSGSTADACGGCDASVDDAAIGDIADSPGTDGADSRTDVNGDGPSCIQLGDIPTELVTTADPSIRISSMRVVDGPCDVSTSYMAVTFLYWQTGYSCPRIGDAITCKVEATSSSGTTTAFTVQFTAVPLSSSMLHWQSDLYQITIAFPSLDGGVEGG